MRQVLDRTRSDGKTKLSELDALAVIEAYGIRTIGAGVARHAPDAALGAMRGAMRGERAVDLARVAEVLVRLGMLATDFPEIEELDINPLRVSAEGALALDARVLLARP